MTPDREEPALFDLPLVPSPPPPDSAASSDPESQAVAEAGEESPMRRPRARAARPESLPLFGEDELEPREPARDSGRSTRASFEPISRGASSRPQAVPRAAEVGSEGEVEGPATAPIPLRLRAGLGDLIVLVAAGALAVAGARALGAAVTLDAWPAILAFLLAFSFLYCVVSLAFWGQTPGMAWSGLVARTDETEPLSFGQTSLRWLGHWLTWALAGLPGLLAITGLGGRSLADRLSGSETYELAPPA